MADSARSSGIGSAAKVGRFAPTPSGRMHVGNVYAMLAAWLSVHAGQAGGAGVSQDSPGRMLLRIEDVDEPRAVPDADRWIMDDLAWLGLDWFGEPVRQSRRTDLYREALRDLEGLTVGDVVDGFAGRPTSVGEAGGGLVGEAMAEPLVYPCFCSRADVRAASEPQEGDRFLVYPGTCRALLACDRAEVRARVAAGRRHSLRAAVPAAGSADCRTSSDAGWAGGFAVRFDDMVFGPQRFDLSREVGDTVIRRSDGLFSYQLAVVVDDLAMGVNDIVRGRDLLRSTALQIWLRRALLLAGFATDGAVVTCADGATNPRYAHLPLIDDSAGRRLAKRRRSLDLGQLRAEGVRPEQVVGYCAWLLGVRAEPGQRGPVPMTVSEVSERFTWSVVRADTSDRRLPQAQAMTRCVLG
jgi:glutamyl-Q tRNA(Asp) synthetase